MRRTVLQCLLAMCALTLVALVAAGTSGCGKEKSDYSGDLTAAAAALSEAGSAHVLVNALVSPPEGEGGMSLNVQGDAWIDFRAPALEARFTVMGMEVSLRYVEGQVFLRAGGRWYTLSPESMGAGENLPSSLAGLLNSLPELLSASVSVDYLGKKRVGSFDCLEVEVHPDIGALSRREEVMGLAEDMGVDPGELEEIISASHPQIKVCIQEGEPVIRQVFLAADAGFSGFNQWLGLGLLPAEGRVEITADFPEYGVEVAVEPPADARPFKKL